MSENLILAQHVLKATTADIVVFIVEDNISEEDADGLRLAIEDITQTIKATVVVFPKNVLHEAKNFDLSDLIELRSEIDELIAIKSLEPGVAQS